MRIKDGKWQTYDIATDDFRDITAADIERWETVTAAFGMLREGIRGLLDATLDVAQGRRNVGHVEITGSRHDAG
jgi:hypothetical protein